MKQDPLHRHLEGEPARVRARIRDLPRIVSDRPAGPGGEEPNAPSGHVDFDIEVGEEVLAEYPIVGRAAAGMMKRRGIEDDRADVIDTGSPRPHRRQDRRCHDHAPTETPGRCPGSSASR